MTIDHGILNVPLSKRGNIDAQLAAYTAAERKANKAAAKVRDKARREAEKTRVRFTAADLAGAVVVRDDCGWVRVVRVNTSTVTVAGGLGEQRIPVGSVLDFRTSPP